MGAPSTLCSFIDHSMFYKLYRDDVIGHFIGASQTLERSFLFRSAPTEMSNAGRILLELSYIVSREFSLVSQSIRFDHHQRFVFQHVDKWNHINTCAVTIVSITVPPET